MPIETRIAGRDALPERVYELMCIAFPDDTADQRTFWPPESVHALVYDGGELVAHAGYLVRPLYTAGRTIETAYVEYVLAEPRGRGHGTVAMRAIEDEIRRRGFSLAALSAGVPEFYDKLGWLRWRGPRAHRAPDGTVVPQPDEVIMVLDLGANVDLDSQIECDWRENGDVW
jgi:aminoglycoside 2'-N-acetyltransferase I